MNDLQVIYILWLRQLKRYWRSRARIMGSLGQPLLFLIALGFGVGPIYSRAGQGNYIEFLVPGVIGMTILFTSVFSGSEIIWDKQFGFLKETLVAPVSRVTIMFGRTLGGATVAFIQGLIVLVLSFIVGFRPVSFALLPLAFLFMILLALLFTAAGTAIASNLDDMQGFQLIVNFIVMPIYFLSGALFPLIGLPAALAFVTRINPLSYGVDAIRHTLINQGIFALSLSFGILAVLVLIFVSLGAYLFRKVQI